MSEKLTRREIREAVFLLLYQNELSAGEPQEIADSCAEAFDMVVKKEMISTAEEVIKRYAELDAVISEFSETREVSRISKVNKTILRLAIYEMTYSDRIPPRAAVNEAVELSKKYAGKQDSAFINGVLGNYIKRLPNAGE